MPSADNWYQTFFTGLALDALRAIPAQTDAEVVFLLGELALPTGGHLLDIPCGNGRLSHPLARRGYRVTGLDISPDLVTEARSDGSGATFQQGDMRQPPTGPFDAAFCFGNSFGYLGREGDPAFLRAVREVLKPGGRFALETAIVAESILPQTLGRRWYPFPGMLFLHDSRYEPTDGTLTSDYIFIKDGREERKTAVYHVVTFRELIAMFASAGFAVRATFGSLNREPYRLGSPRLLAVVERA